MKKAFRNKKNNIGIRVDFEARVTALQKVHGNEFLPIPLPGNAFQHEDIVLQAYALGTTYDVFNPLYRISGRSPEQIANLGGFFPNAYNPRRGLVTSQIDDETGNWVSLTSRPENQWLYALVGGRRLRPGVASTFVHEYEILGAKAVDMRRLGLSGEDEFTSAGVVANLVQRVRAVHVRLRDANLKPVESIALPGPWIDYSEAVRNPQRLREGWNP